jgi:hypothetical protein
VVVLLLAAVVEHSLLGERMEMLETVQEIQLFQVVRLRAVREVLMEVSMVVQGV